MSVPTHTRAHAHRRTCSNPGSQNWSWNFMVFIFCGPMANSAGAVLGPWWAFLFFKVRQMELLTAMSNSPHEGGSFMMRKFLNSWAGPGFVGHGHMGVPTHTRAHANRRTCRSIYVRRRYCYMLAPGGSAGRKNQSHSLCYYSTDNCLRLC